MVNQVMKDRSDLLHLQNTYRLTWVPDEVTLMFGHIFFKIVNVPT